MSYAHVRLRQIEKKQNHLEYQVESFDFNQQKEWEKIGKLSIDLTNNNYQFYPEPVWKSQKILPPSVFGLEPTEREQVIQSCYPDYGGGAWSMQIHHWATSFLKRRSFPQYHPSTFFPEKVLFPAVRH
jgi:hypothetical protein